MVPFCSAPVVYFYSALDNQAVFPLLNFLQWLARKRIPDDRPPGNNQLINTCGEVLSNLKLPGGRQPDRNSAHAADRKRVHRVKSDVVDLTGRGTDILQLGRPPDQAK